MKQTNINENELYFHPKFYTKILNDNDSVIQKKYESIINNQYTEFKVFSEHSIILKYREIRFIELSHSVIDYEDNIWDVSAYTILKNRRRKMIFNDVPDSFIKNLKDYILMLILVGNIKESTLKTKLSKMKKFTTFLDKRGIVDFANIDIIDMIDFLDTYKENHNLLLQYVSTIKEFIIIYDLEYKTEILTKEIIELFDRRKYNNKLKAQRKQNRRHSIPDEFFNKLIKILIETMDNKEESIRLRSIAAILIIDTQTGLRASELSILEANSVESIIINGKNFRMLNFKIIKQAKGSVGYKKNITFFNDLAFKAYQFLMEVYEENREFRNVNLLFCPENVILPVDSSYFVECLKRICIDYADTLDTNNPKYNNILSGKATKESLQRCRYSSSIDFKKRNQDISNNNGKDLYYYPVLHQFRNTIISTLIRHGVNPEYIRRYMGHLSIEMTMSYSRINDTEIQENVNISEDVLRTYLTGDAKILGNSGNQVMQRIDEWIKQNNFNVEKDLETIIEKLLNLIPIRAKHGGMCIKGYKLVDACSVDSKTDEFFCAYGVCPNVCHFYFQIDITYSDFSEVLRIYKYNSKNGFLRQAEKELNKIKFIISNRLNPEIIELEREISDKGINQIINKHAELSKIISNLDKIKEEIKLWS